MGNDFLRTLSVLVNRLYSDLQANKHVQDVYTPSWTQLGECLCQKLERFQNDLHTLQENVDCNNDTNSSYRTEHTLHRADRPSYNISQEQLETFDELGFSVTATATFLGVSRHTVINIRRLFGLSSGSARCSDIRIILRISLWHLMLERGKLFNLLYFALKWKKFVMAKHFLY